ncbi:MAG: hypothetical protein GC200_06975 [Tepidisphaera sp.]|nr:hypothetical protein [Tepidisphaera sp.]
MARTSFMFFSLKSLDIWRRTGNKEQAACREAAGKRPAGLGLLAAVFSGVEGWRREMVMRTRYMMCCVVATLIWASGAWGQFGGAQAPAGGGFPDAGDAAPSPDETMAAFMYVRARVRGEEAPAAPAMAGAGVVLRLHGEIVGRGWSVAEKGALAEATEGALREMERRLPPMGDALEAERRPGLLREVTISVEAAGRAVPISLGTYDDADLTLSPGVDGVAVRGQDGVEAVFPSQMLYAGLTPSAGYTSCVVKLSGDAGLAVRHMPGREAGDIAAGKHYTFLHFRVRQLAQGEGALTPSFLYRGARVVRGEEMTTPAMEAWREKLAAGLLRSVREGRVGPEYDFARNIEMREEDSPEVNALVALALAEYARGVRGEGETARGAVKGAAGLLGSVLARAGGIGGRPRALGQAATALAALGTLRLADAGAAIEVEAAHPGAREALEGVVRGALEEGAGGTRAWKAGSGDSERGLACWALAMMEDPLTPPAMVATFRDAPGGKLMGAMPWLQWAASSWGGGEGELASAPAMRDLRDTLSQAQLKPGQCDPDEEGAIMFSRGGGVRPTWQSARGSLLLAGMLGDGRLTGKGEILPQVVKLVGSLRYLRQLTVDESLGWIAVDPARAEWTVRPALWEMKSSPEAGAMVLLSVTRSLEAMEGAAGRLGAGR